MYLYNKLYIEQRYTKINIRFFLHSTKIINVCLLYLLYVEIFSFVVYDKKNKIAYIHDEIVAYLSKTISHKQSEIGQLKIPFELEHNMYFPLH